VIAGNNNTILEYVWLDGYDTPNLRSKIKVEQDWGGIAPSWNFDGSSTRQALGHDSECLLQPVRLYKYALDHYLVLCEVNNSDGSSHVSNHRAPLRLMEEYAASSSFWWGFEQEYFLTKDKNPIGFPAGGYPEPQGLYYCGVGSNQVKGRHLVEAHLRRCLDMGIQLTGVNAEVTVGQWEFQCFATDTLKACDDLWMSRYLLYKMAESEGLDADMNPKPVKGDWNGSGCHANFSDHTMRTSGDEGYFMAVLNTLDSRHMSHIDEYGEGNNYRLTGEHETQHIGQFSWGVADRGASIRVPSTTAVSWKGYLEDRRPASNCDPYRVTRLIVDAVKSIQ
jgi:glutamine synthetase